MQVREILLRGRLSMPNIQDANIHTVEIRLLLVCSFFNISCPNRLLDIFAGYLNYTDVRIFNLKLVSKDLR